jgi:hypothetical protein
LGYPLPLPEPNAGKYVTLNIDNKPFENMAEFKYWRGPQKIKIALIKKLTAY